jgi:two-component system, response regulator PdtaR
MAELDQATTGVQPERAAAILLAEDEPLVRWDIAERLRDAGWHVIEVASADAGIELLNSGMKVDLVLTDINMPGETDGLELALFAATIPGIKIVLMSGVPSSLIPGIERAPKDHSFINKPFDDATMIASIGALLGRNGGEHGDVSTS